MAFKILMGKLKKVMRVRTSEALAAYVRRRNTNRQRRRRNLPPRSGRPRLLPNVSKVMPVWVTDPTPHTSSQWGDYYPFMDEQGWKRYFPPYAFIPDDLKAMTRSIVRAIGSLLGSRPVVKVPAFLDPEDLAISHPMEDIMEKGFSAHPFHSSRVIYPNELSIVKRWRPRDWRYQTRKEGTKMHPDDCALDLPRKGQAKRIPSPDEVKKARKKERKRRRREKEEKERKAELLSRGLVQLYELKLIDSNEQDQEVRERRRMMREDNEKEVKYIKEKEKKEEIESVKRSIENTKEQIREDEEKRREKRGRKSFQEWKEEITRKERNKRKLCELFQELRSIRLM